jgi:hypothetical protein
MTKTLENTQTKKSINANGMMRINKSTNELEFENHETKRKLKATMSYGLLEEIENMFKFVEKNNRGFAKGKIQILFY